MEKIKKERRRVYKGTYSTARILRDEGFLSHNENTFLFFSSKRLHNNIKPWRWKIRDASQPSLVDSGSSIHWSKDDLMWINSSSTLRKLNYSLYLRGRIIRRLGIINQRQLIFFVGKIFVKKICFIENIVMYSKNRW